MNSGINNDTGFPWWSSVFNESMDFQGLQHFTYNNSKFVEIVHHHLAQTNFEGITVSISMLVAKFQNDVTKHNGVCFLYMIIDRLTAAIQAGQVLHESHAVKL